MISEQVLAQWWCLVAFRKALDLLYWSMCSILYHHIAMAIEMANKVGILCIVVLSIVALAAAGAIQSE